MGTSGAYGGSGGKAWGKARTQAGEYANDPTAENAGQLLADIAKALDWDADAQPPVNPQQQLPLPTPLRIRGSAGGADVPGGGGGGGGGGGNGGSGGGGRSRAKAASVGGGVAAAGLAFRARDEDTLQRYGLTLAELDVLEPHEQARRILDAVAGSVGGVEEDELQHASGVAVLALLDENATADDAIRVFITDYVFEVSITEVGDQLRDGTRDGLTTVQEEDQLRNLIEAGVNQLTLPDRLDADNIQQVIFGALDEARIFLRANADS